MGFLSGVTDTLFGKDPKLETQGKTTLTAGQNKALEEVLLPFLTGTPFQDVKGTPFEGQLSAGQTDLERQLAGAAGSTIEGTTDTFGRVSSALDPFLAGDVGDFEDFFQRTVAEPGLQQFQEDILPALDRQFGPSGFFGSERNRANVRATEDLTDALTRERSRIGFETRESALDRALQAAQISGQLPGQAAGALGQLAPIAGTERQVQQQALDREFQEFLRVNVAERDKRIEQLLAALNIQGVENLGAAIPGTQGIAQSFLGGGGAGGLMELFK